MKPLALIIDDHWLNAPFEQASSVQRPVGISKLHAALPRPPALDVRSCLRSPSRQAQSSRCRGPPTLRAADACSDQRRRRLGSHRQSAESEFISTTQRTELRGRFVVLAIPCTNSLPRLSSTRRSQCKHGHSATLFARIGKSGLAMSIFSRRRHHSREVMNSNHPSDLNLCK
jgi:hypothetical protein